MNAYVYPALFHRNDDGIYTVTFPDLPGCITEGDSVENALYMAQDALSSILEVMVEQKMEIPVATEVGAIQVGQCEFASLVRAEIKDTKAVRRTVSIPKWMDDGAAKASLSLSRVLQDALKERLNA